MRRRDVVRVATEEGEFTAFEKLSLKTDFTEVATLTMTFGNIGSFRTIEPIVAQGRRVQVYLNGLLQFSGRFDARKVPTKAQSGSTIDIIARTRLADAKVASALPSLSFKNVSVKQFVQALLEPLGYGPGDLLFAAAADRNLVTGKKTGAADLVDLEPIKQDQLRINPPETVEEVLKRVLNRFHLMHWDAADGRLLFGRPDDTQPSLYQLLCRRGAGAIANNVLEIERIEDWTNLPSEVWVYGASGPHKDISRSSTGGVAVDLDALRVAADTGHFARRVIIPKDGIKSKEAADAAARREMANRSKEKDGWMAKVDGWSFFTGQASIPYAINTMSDVDVHAVASRTSGRYLVASLERALDKDDGLTSSLSLLAPGIFDI
jgi:prophage tail gpP-like protein